MTDTYYDYIYKFPQTGLTAALSGMQALIATGLLGAEKWPSNSLGDWRDASGAIVASPFDADGNLLAAWRGAPGRAAMSYTDPTTNEQISVPAAGDPAQYYVWMRGTLSPGDVTVDGSTYGLTAIEAAEAAPVLGVWAS